MENARSPVMAEPSAPNSANSTAEDTKPACITPRAARVLAALLQSGDWISREEVDRIAGASNGPAVIQGLRRKVTGHDGIEMQTANATDRDGRACKPGRYRLTSIGRQRAAMAIRIAREVA